MHEDAEVGDVTDADDEQVPARGVGARVHPIRVIGDPVLRAPCDPVTAFDDHLARLVEEMFATMYAADGVGLAANQIGIGWRLFVYDCPDVDGVHQVGVVANPRIVSVEGEVDDVEGCLSVPGPHEDLVRAAVVVCEGVDERGEPVRVTGTGILARCLLHETDHLDGLLYVDRLAPKVRRRVLDQVVEPADPAPRSAFG